MKYFRKDNTVYAYDEQQLAMGYGKDMTPMTAEEVELHINPPKTEEQLLEEKISEAKSLLDTTEFKFNDDYDQKDTPEWLELKAKRQEARDFIRANA